MRHLHARPWFDLAAHEDPPAPAPPAPAPPTPDPDADKTFVQADVDRIVSERLAREKAKYADYDDVKAKAEQFDAVQAAQQTELERAQSENVKLQKERDDIAAEQAADRRRNALERAASKAKFHDPSDAASQIDASRLEVDANGAITNADALVAEIATSKPYLVAGDATPPGTPPPTPGVDAGPKGDTPGAAPPTDFSKADNGDFASELAKYGLRPRS